MNQRTNILVSVLVLLIYGTLTFVAVPFHHHDHPLFMTGSGIHSLTQHEDALNCHHHIADIHDDCTVCSISSRASLVKVVGVLPRIETDRVQHPLFLHIAAVEAVHSAHAHRGPPVLVS